MKICDSLGHMDFWDFFMEIFQRNLVQKVFGVFMEIFGQNVFQKDFCFLMEMFQRNVFQKVVCLRFEKDCFYNIFCLKES